MHSCDLRFPAYDAAARQSQIRWALLVHHDVRDVMLTPHSDTLRLIYSGPPEAGAWSATLVDAGYPAPRVEEAGAAWLQRRERAS
ncbi:MAG TPA: hypothetical protein VGM91_13500 [Conexibacter sp.]